MVMSDAFVQSTHCLEVTIKIYERSNGINRRPTCFLRGDAEFEFRGIQVKLCINAVKTFSWQWQDCFKQACNMKHTEARLPVHRLKATCSKAHLLFHLFVHRIFSRSANFPGENEREKFSKISASSSIQEKPIAMYAGGKIWRTKDLIFSHIVAE